LIAWQQNIESPPPIPKTSRLEFNMPAPDCQFVRVPSEDEDEVIASFCAQQTAAPAQEIAASAELEEGELAEDESDESERAAGADKNKINPWYGLK
jgi:hypothetical protein